MTPEEHIACIRDWHRDPHGPGVTSAIDRSALALCDAYEALAAAGRAVVVGIPYELANDDRYGPLFYALNDALRRWEGQ